MLLEPPDRLPFPGALPGRLREVHRGAALRRESTDHFVACWKESGRMLKLNGVSKVYRVGTFGGKELHAVNDVSFDVKDGEVVSLIGESGSGKSTIGKMILRLISTSAGRSTSTASTSSTLKGGALKEYYRHGPGRVPGPFQLLQPDLQGGSGLRDHPGGVLSRRCRRHGMAATSSRRR